MEQKAENDAAKLLVQYDRLVADGNLDIFGHVDDPERMQILVNEAGKVGATLFWLKERLAFRWLVNSELGTTPERLQEHYQRVPWSSPKHSGWRAKYKAGWNYDFTTDEWRPPGAKV